MGACQSSDAIQTESQTEQVGYQTHIFDKSQIPAAPPKPVQTKSGTVGDYLIPQVQGEIHDEYDTTLKLMKEQNITIFKDSKFPASRQSISSDANFLKGKDISWKRPMEFMDQGGIKLFDNIEPMDIKQGELGDCYLLSSLSALAEIPNQIDKLFITKQFQQNGLYGIYICHNGMMKQVAIDDYIPCKLQGGPIFSRSNGNELWVLLLEKAYAKLFGQYHRIESGLSGCAFRDLTGAPYEYFIRKTETQVDADKSWEFIDKYTKANYILTASSEVSDGGMEFQKSSGIVSQHCYAILDTQIVVGSDGRQARIIQIRNPWGRKEWNGDWGDQSNKWTPALRQKLNAQSKDDGLFWIGVEDFIQEFSQVCCCKLIPNYIYTSMKLPTNSNDQVTRKVMLMRVYRKAHGFITLSQTDKRNIEGGKHTYSLARMVVGLIDPQTNVIRSYQGSVFDNDRDVCIESNFEAGDYAVYIEVDWNQAYDRHIVLSSYCQEAVQFIESNTTSEQQEGILNGLLRVHEVFTDEEKVKEYSKSIKRISGSVGGYIYYIYYNNSIKDILKESITIKNRKNMEICPPEVNSDHFEVEIKPGQHQLIKFRITKDGNGSFGYSSSIQFVLIEHLTDDVIIQRALQKPDKVIQRSLNNQNIDVFINVLNYPAGLAFVYENRTKQTFKEDLQLTLKNLEGANCDAHKNISISIPPQKSQLISLRTIDYSQPTSYSMQNQFSLV